LKVDDLIDMTDLEKMETQHKQLKLNKALANANDLLLTIKRNSLFNASVTKTSTFEDDLDLDEGKLYNDVIRVIKEKKRKKDYEKHDMLNFYDIKKGRRE
jgi:hypothetical protein